jgi:hypothetical protein
VITALGGAAEIFATVKQDENVMMTNTDFITHVLVDGDIDMT